MKNFRFHILDSQYWSQRYESDHMLFVKLGIHCYGSKHLYCTLTVTNISYPLISSDSHYIFPQSRLIKFCHLRKWKCEILFSSYPSSDESFKSNDKASKSVTPNRFRIYLLSTSDELSFAIRCFLENPTLKTKLTCLIF